MRIMLDCRYIGPKPSGIGEVVMALAEHLPALAPDHEFTFLCQPGAPLPLSAASNVRHAVVRSPANGPATLLSLPLAVNLAGIDLFHAPANILPGGLDMPTITTIHDIMWLTHPRWCNPSLWGRVEQAFYAKGITRALARSTAVTTVSRASYDAIVGYRPDVAGRVTVIPSGVSGDFTPVARDDVLLERLGIGEVRPFILVVGQNAPYKNHERCMRAFAAALAAGEDVDLVFVQRRSAGETPLGELAGKLGIGTRVRILHTISRVELIQLYCAADLLLHPSLCEGFGNPVAEAMACGCPVITSNCSAMPQVAGDAAILVDPFDIESITAGLRRVISDPILRAAMRERGLVRAAALDWHAFAEAHLTLYRKVLGGD